ncbi:MAG: SUMF1/EgtB/PvdO family nonheme iron enzyme [Chloroflexota bacterium]|nr:SUMF1/EgtB/PvdO family nonheme iron enzyme [Chloroflexota bacterium]
MPQNRAPQAILSDQPARDDCLNFTPYAKTLAEIIAAPQTDTPLTIGVFGGWGRGKTSLMQMVQDRLAKTAESDFPIRTIWFNAWLYSRERALWRALIARVVQSVRRFALADAQQATLDQLEERLYQPASAGDERLLLLPPGSVPGLETMGAFTPASLDLLRRQAQRAGEQAQVDKLDELLYDAKVSRAVTWREQLVALDDFRREFEQLSKRCIAPHGRLVVFIDDLDRCLPDKAVEVLEAVKLFLDVPGFVFVLGVDRSVIAEGIRVRYQDYATELDGARYLEKIIQIPFKLPPIDAGTVAGYVHEITAGNLPDARCETVFSVGLEPNPRRIKRTLNVFLLLWRLAQNRADLADAIQPVRLAKIVVIQQYYLRLFELLVDGPHYLPDLEERFRTRAEARNAPELQERTGRGGGMEPGETEEISAGPLQPFLGQSLLRELLTCTSEDEEDANFAGPHGLTPGGVLTYIYLTRSTVEEEATKKTLADKRLPFEPQLVTIPAGPFLMGTPESELDELEKLGRTREYIEREVPQHEVTLDEYAIARYPITNAEFERFIEDGGYDNSDYWTDAGWQWKEKESWTQPRYWDDDKWNTPSQPVVGVSWYEAVAYCRWLSEKSGKTYRLPTEAEWEKAARGTDGRRYPWGADWDASLCNNKESGPGQTTPVGERPEGESPYGVEELVGQVWEWCRTKYSSYPYQPNDGREDEDGGETRILRGGSWYSSDPAGVCRCGCRVRNDPWDWDFNRGFRCVRTLSSVP